MTATATERTVTLMRLAPEEEEAIHQMRADERVAKRCQIAAAHTDTCISKEDSGPLREQLVHAAIISALKEQEEHIRNSPIYHDIILDGVGLEGGDPSDPPRPQGDRTEVARTGMAAGLPRPGDDDTCAPPPADYSGTPDQADQQHPILHEVAQKRTTYIMALARANRSADECKAKRQRMKDASNRFDADSKDADAARHEYFNALAEAVKQGQGPNIG